MEALIIILYIVFAVLGLILFFKVWGMTNNVKRIADLVDYLAELAQDAENRRIEQEKGASKKSSSGKAQTEEQRREEEHQRQAIEEKLRMRMMLRMRTMQ